MAATATRTRSKANRGFVPSAADVEVAEQIVRAGRQTFLEALPIAAAAFQLADDGTAHIDLANARFRELIGADSCVGPVGGFDFLAASGIAARAETFLTGSDQTAEFGISIGHAVAGRHFAVRFTRLS